MKRWKKIWLYSSATLMWLFSQIGITSADNIKDITMTNYDNKGKSDLTDPVYLRPNQNSQVDSKNTFQSLLHDIFSNDMIEYRHYSHSSHRSHSSHSSHTSHYSHYSGTGNSYNYNSPAITRSYDTISISIQRKLNDLGYDCGEPDGLKGPQTVEAIKSFQADYGLNMDGVVGSETKKYLDSITIKAVKKRLSDLGYPCDDTDIRDDNTVQAIKDFQQANGLEVTAKINSVTKQALDI